MLISDFLDSIEGTEQEAVFLGNFVELTTDEDVKALLDKPVIGKLLGALVALGNSHSVGEFRQTEYYDGIKDWGITVFDLEKGMYSIHPGPKHLRVVFGVIAAVGIGFIAYRLFRRYRIR